MTRGGENLIIQVGDQPDGVSLNLKAFTIFVFIKYILIKLIII